MRILWHRQWFLVTARRLSWCLLAGALLALPRTLLAQTTPPPAAAPVAAPDIVIRRDGTELAVKVEEVTPDVVKYRRADNMTGPLFSVLKSELFMVKYANGTREVFQVAAAPAPTPAPVVVMPTYNQQPYPAGSAPYGYAGFLTAEDSVFRQVAANGPRVGMTVIGRGKLRDRLRDEFNSHNVVSQFGWQFESRLFQLPNGPSGLVEFVPLVAGLEQGLFLPSLSMLLGLRGRSGLEIGFGPNVSLAGAGLVIAAGHTVQGKYLNIPLNFAVVPSREGVRYSLLIGFTYKTRR